MEMKDILNRMLNHEELSREETRDIIVGTVSYTHLYLVGVNSLVPVNAFLGARLVLKLFEECL